MSTATAPTPTIAPASPRRLVDFVLRARTFGILGVLALFVLDGFIGPIVEELYFRG